MLEPGGRRVAWGPKGCGPGGPRRPLLRVGSQRGRTADREQGPAASTGRWSLLRSAALWDRRGAASRPQQERTPRAAEATEARVVASCRPHAGELSPALGRHR